MKISIQCCQNCTRHEWHFPHKEASYINCFTRLASALAEKYPSATILKNDPQDLGRPPRIGCFQVRVNGKLVFSKLKERRWPRTEEIIQRIERQDEQTEPRTGEARTNHAFPQERNTDFHQINLNSLSTHYTTSDSDWTLYKSVLREYRGRNIRHRLKVKPYQIYMSPKESNRASIIKLDRSNSHFKTIY